MNLDIRIAPGIGTRLKAERLRLGLTQEGLAEKLGLSKVTLYFYERGTRHLDIPTLEKLAKVGVNLGVLLAGSQVNLVTSTGTLSVERLVEVLPAVLGYLHANPKDRDSPEVMRALISGFALAEAKPISGQKKAPKRGKRAA